MRIYKGTTASLSFQLCLCFSEDFENLKIALWTTDMDEAIVFSGDSITIEPGKALIDIEKHTLDPLDDGVVYFNAMWDDGTKVAPSSYYLKSPSNYSEIETISKSQLEEISISGNGTYTPTYGYKKVIVNVTDGECDHTEAFQSGKTAGYNSGYTAGAASVECDHTEAFNSGKTAGYESGYTAGSENVDCDHTEAYQSGKTAQMSLLKTLNVTENGTYYNLNGYNRINVMVGSQCCDLDFNDIEDTYPESNQYIMTRADADDFDEDKYYIMVNPNSKIYMSSLLSGMTTLPSWSDRISEYLAIGNYTTSNGALVINTDDVLKLRIKHIADSQYYIYDAINGGYVDVYLDSNGNLHLINISDTLPVLMESSNDSGQMEICVNYTNTDTEDTTTQYARWSTTQEKIKFSSSNGIGLYLYAIDKISGGTVIGGDTETSGNTEPETVGSNYVLSRPSTEDLSDPSTVYVFLNRTYNKVATLNEEDDGDVNSKTVTLSGSTYTLPEDTLFVKAISGDSGYVFVNVNTQKFFREDFGEYLVESVTAHTYSIKNMNGHRCVSGVIDGEEKYLSIEPLNPPYPRFIKFTSGYEYNLMKATQA